MFLDKEKSKKIKTAALSLGMVGLVAGTLSLSGCASCSRATKSLSSDLDGGMYRIVRVYDVNGDLISEYAGFFDVEYDNNRIIFDDEDGKRHQIFIGTGTVEIDEVTEEEVKELQTDGNVKVYTKKMAE